LDLELRAAGLGGHKLLGNGREDDSNNVEAVRASRGTSQGISILSLTHIPKISLRAFINTWLAWTPSKDELH